MILMESVLSSAAVSRKLIVSERLVWPAVTGTEVVANHTEPLDVRANYTGICM